MLEFKKGKKDLSALTESADYAIDQIIKKKYAEPYIKEGYRNVYGIGIGFGGKDCTGRKFSIRFTYSQKSITSIVIAEPSSELDIYFELKNTFWISKLRLRVH